MKQTTAATALALPQNRKAILQTDIVCGTFYTEFKSQAQQCQSCTTCYHPTCAEIPLYYMVKYERSTIKFQCKQYTEQFVEPHWTDTAHRFRHYYNNGANMENPHDLNDTDVPTEESIIESQTQNTEETPNELAEEQRTQSNDNEHETHQLDPTSSEATMAIQLMNLRTKARAKKKKINPCGWGIRIQGLESVCLCACHKRQLIIGYKLSYASGLLYAWCFYMQWGVWVWAVGHWVVLVQVRVYRI